MCNVHDTDTFIFDVHVQNIQMSKLSPMHIDKIAVFELEHAIAIGHDLDRVITIHQLSS